MWRFGFITALIFCLGPGEACRAAETGQALTNADLLRMLGAGVPEGTILLAIESAGWRRTIELDASPGALAELRKQGATERILNAVLEMEAAQRFRAAREKILAGRPAGLPARPGVYYRGSSGWVSLPSTFLWPRLTASWIGFGDRYRVDLGGRQAQYQLLDRRPAFYLPDYTPEGQWQLLRLNQKRNRRELRAGPRDVFPWDMAIRADAYREIEIRVPSEGLLTIQPRSDLDPGEYLLCHGVRGSRSLVRCYEFGVAQAKPGAQTPG